MASHHIGNMPGTAIQRAIGHLPFQRQRDGAGPRKGKCGPCCVNTRWPGPFTIHS